MTLSIAYKTRYFLSFFSLILAITAPAKASNISISVVSETAKLQAASVPSGDWTGVLALPKLNERRVDGGVWFVVYSAPEQYRQLVGKTLWLTRAATDHASFIDVHFNDEAKKQLAKTDNAPVLRKRVDAWARVSPLESLAAAHSIDDLVVSFDEGQLKLSDADSTNLISNAEPIIQSGPQESVVRFKQQISKTEFIVETVTEPSQEFHIQMVLREDQITPNIEKIETSHFLSAPQNEKGWIIQGFIHDSFFDTYAVSPYELYTVSNPDYRLIEDRNNFRTQELWNLDVSQGRVQKIMTAPTDFSFALGDEFFVFNAFGSYNDEGTLLGMVTGHSALGWAKVVKHRQTGDLVLRSGYWQIYYNSPRGIISAKYDSIAYNGDLFRIESFFRPIADVLIPLKSLNGNSRVWENFGRSQYEGALEDLMHKVRIGYGHGYLRETLISTCVHDGANIFAETLDNILANSNSDEPAFKVFASVKDVLGNAVPIPDKFHDSSQVQLWDGIPEALQNENLVIPRLFQDAVVRGFINSGVPVIARKTLLISQEGDALKPTPPYGIHLYDALLMGLPKDLHDGW